MVAEPRWHSTFYPQGFAKGKASTETSRNWHKTLKE